MTKQTEALKLALEWDKRRKYIMPYVVRDAIREALAEESSGTEQSAHSEAYWQHEVNNAYANGYTKGRASCLHDEKMKSKQPAQPQQEPVAWSKAYDMIDRFLQNNLNSDEDRAEYSAALDCLYTSPPASKPWVGLTDEEQDECVDIADEAHINKPMIFWSEHHYNAIETKLREKNGGNA